MAISIPVKAYITALNGSSAGWTESVVRTTFRIANAIWQKSGIFFDLKSIEAIDETPPPSGIEGKLDDDKLFYLGSKYPGRDCPSAFFVKTFAGKEGGTATQMNAPPWLLAVGYSTNQTNLGRMLAHEFGHLLNLGHSDEGFVQGPDNPIPARMRDNLMFSALTVGTTITDSQIREAFVSELAKRFGSQ